MGQAQSRPQHIRELRAAGYTYRFIADRFKCSFRAISSASQAQDAPKKIGRPRKITPEISSYIETLSCLDSALTNFEIANLVRSRWPTITLSESSVSAERIKLGFTWRPPLVKQELTSSQARQRLQFTSDLMAMGLNPLKIIFSDESRFVLGDDHRWRHLRRGEWNETAFARTTKFPESVMIWGAIGVDYKSGCFFCSQGVDSEEYQGILLRSRLVEELDQKHGRFGWYFMQDGASAHTSKATADFLKQCLLLPGWPPNSPDLNPIEMIWAIMKSRVKKAAPHTKTELEEVIAKLWDELETRVLNRLVMSFNTRLEMVLKVHGRSISPYLSSHRDEPTPEDAADDPGFRPFGRDEDNAILEWVDRIGNHWKRISEVLAPRFGPRERIEVKHRAKWLTDTRENQRRAEAAVPDPDPEERARDPEVPAPGSAFAPEQFFSGAAFPLEDAG
jgi:transposase